LVAVLTRLKITATPVLVHTALGQRLAADPPNLTAFNHCIVGMNLGGRRYYLDPTLFPQGGGLDVLCQARLGWCLPLQAGAELEDMGPEPLSDSFTVTTVYELPREIDAPGSAEIRTTYFGWRADLVRRRLAAGADDYAQATLGPFKRAFETATEKTPLAVSDDLAANRIELTQTLELGRVWRLSNDGRAMFEPPDLHIRPNLPILSRETRRSPVALGRPLKLTSTVDIHSPIAAPPKAWDRSLDSCGLRATSKLSAADNTNRVIRLERTLEFDREALDPGDVPAFASFIEELMPLTAVAVRLPARNGAVVAGVPASNAEDRRADRLAKRFVVSWAVIAVFMILVSLISQIPH
jgi:hypothetical protein